MSSSCEPGRVGVNCVLCPPVMEDECCYNRRRPSSPGPFLTEDSILNHLRIKSGSDGAAGPSRGEPTMKKARYLWQIKGHYRHREEERKKKNLEKEEEVRCYRHVLARWQDKQETRSYFDNTINGLIEKTGLFDPDDCLDYLIEDYVNPLVGGENFMDEAVGEAIRSHGLHTPCLCPELLPPPPRPCVPFHRRGFWLSDDASTSMPTTDINVATLEAEMNVLTEAVNAAIQKKGLGAYTTDNNR